MQKCLDGGDKEENTKFNAAVIRKADECRTIVDTYPPKTPCQVAERKEPTQYTFCQHNLRTQYRRKDGTADNKVCPCGVKKAAQVRPPTTDERLAAAIQCMARPLPRYFNEPERCDPMSVCCSMLSGPKYCPNRGPEICACQAPLTNKDKFSVNYPPNKLTVRNVMQVNPECTLYVRCANPPKGPRTENGFRPDYIRPGLTEKFYSRYERINDESTPQVRAYEEELQRRRDFFPRDHYCVPWHTNQMYGWFKGKKLLALENCGKRSEQKVLAHLRQLPNNRIEPMQMNYCYCKERMKRVRWKIVDNAFNKT